MALNAVVDLFRVVKQAVQVSENSYSIKNIEKFYPDKFKRSGNIQKGDVSEEYYIEWLETKNQKLLDEIEDYNKQDCVSTYYLREWLLDIKPKNTSWFVSDKEEIEIRDHEKLIIEYQNKIRL